MSGSDDRFVLYDLKVEVIAGDKPMVCNHQPGDWFALSGENLSLPPGQSFPLYPLAALLPLLPARQRETHPNDWMTTDTVIACPDPHCGGRFRITRTGKREFRHGEVSAVPLGLATPVELAEGYTIPRLLKGGWQLAGGHGPVDRAQAIRDMFAFAEAGVTAFDCADIYTGVEELIGAFLAEWRQAHPSGAGGIKVHTKCVPDLDALASLDRAGVERIVDRSLRRLGVERLDLVQLHWWDWSIPGWVEAAGHLHDLQRAGKIRLIGATNFDAERLGQLLDAGVPVASNQVQYSPLDRRPAGRLAALCAARGVKLLCYGALAGGFVSRRWLGAPEPAEPLENRSLTKYKLIIDEFGGWELFQQLLRTLSRIGDRHGVSPGAVSLRWTLEQPQVAAAIAGARGTAHLADTLAALQLPLDAADRAAIDTVLSLAQGPAGEVYGLERIKGGRHAAIMKYNLNAQALR